MIFEWMNKHNRLLTLIFGALIMGALILLYANQPEPEMAVGYSSDAVQAQVIKIIEEGQVILGEVEQIYQVVIVDILEGEFKGQLIDLEYGKRQLLSDNYRLEEGRKVLVSVMKMPDGNLNVHFIDHVRTNALVILVVLFVIICVLVGGWKGIKSLVSILLSIFVIFLFIVPQILQGKDPVMVSIIGSFAFLAFSLYIIYGWTLKTHIALAGVFFAMIITGVLSYVFVNFAHLNGFGDESAMYLVQQASVLNIKNLLIAGIFIGTLGVLDDLVIGQTSAVIEIYRANPDMSMGERFKSAMEIGRDHVSATVNTLLLAYIGASLTMILLFSMTNTNFLTLVNLNYIAEEIVRSLVGTIGLFLSVPVTTFIASWAVSDVNRLTRLVEIFGPLVNINESN
jgi:uncharacterized membrane protein